MPLPPGLQTVTLTDTRQHPDGGPMRGRLTLVPEVPVVASPDHGLIVMGPASAEWTNGTLSLTVLAGNATGINPTGWTYRAYEAPLDAAPRSYPLLLTADLGTVDLATLAPVSSSAGEYVTVAGPAGPQGPTGATGATGPKGDPGDPASNLVTSVAGKQGVVVLVASDVGADAAGAAAGAQAAAASDATTKVSTHAGASDPHGDRAWASGQFATITVVTTLSGTVGTLNTFIDDLFNRVAAIEQGTAVLAGVHANGPVLIDNHSLDVTGYTTLAGGQFNGNAAVFGDLKHLGDPASQKLAFWNATPITRPTVTGSRGGNAALASLVTALANLGLITDGTSA